MKTCSINTGGNYSISCSHCDKTFPFLSRLKRHMVTCSNEPTEKNPIHFCEYCGKTFPFLSHLKRHNLMTKCSITSGKINSEFNYANQYPMIEENQYENQEWDSKNLKTPKNQVTNVDYIKRELESYEQSKELPSAYTKDMFKHENSHYCPHCAKTFPNNSRLKRHMVVCRICTGKDGPHLCPNCGKSFPFQSRLKRHLPVCPVANKKTHTCLQCEKNFPYASRLKRHLEQVHNVFELNPGIVSSELDYDNQYPVIHENQSENQEWDPSKNLEIPNSDQVIGADDIKRELD